MSNQNTNKPFHQIHIGYNRTGKNYRVIREIIPELLKGNKVRFIGCEDPEHITKILLDHGIKVKSEPLMNNSTDKITSFLDSPIGSGPVQKTQTGFIFYCE